MRLKLEGFPDILNATPSDVAHAVLQMWRPKEPTFMMIKQHPFCKSGLSEVVHLASTVR
jgi:hypothetical protein